MNKRHKWVVTLCCVCGFFFPLTISAEEILAKSKITSVIVYPDSAFVTRRADVNLPVGPSSVVFENVLTGLDENSLRVSGEGTATAKIFGAQVKKEYLKQSSDARVQEIESKIEKLSDQMALENSNFSVLDQEKEFLNSVKLFSGQQIPKDLVTQMPATSDLESMLTFVSTKLRDIEAKREEVRFRVRDIQREKTTLEQELGQLRGGQNKVSRSIVVDMECAKPGKLTLDISYLVSNVRWRPLYDARTSLEKSEVELTSFGVIQQTTGEDWVDAELTLSTARPSRNGSMPYVSPWVLQTYQPQDDLRGGKIQRSLSDSVQYAAFREGNNSLASDEIGMPNASLAQAPTAPAQTAFTQVQERGISVTYKVPRNVTIKSDGSEQKLPVSTQKLVANFEYSSFPKASAHAYLGSRVTNAADLQLLGGQVNLFLDGDFVGSSSVPDVSPAETFDLYLGVDENVKIKREEISRKVDDVLIGNIPSPNKTTTVKIKLSVENQKGKKSRVILFEAMPVSENERIKVKVFDVSTPPKEKDWRDRKGVWRWELDLESKEKKEIFYSYTVEHPRDFQVLGL